MKAAEALLTEELEQRLAEAEATIAALLAGQIDAVFDPEAGIRAPILLAEAQTALRKEHDRAQRYLDAPEVILLSLNLQGQVTLANRYACDVLGWTKAELVGRDWISTCIPARLRPGARGVLENLMAGDLPLMEGSILTRSGEERLIEWRNTLLRDDRGAVIGTFSTGTDITERRLAEAELQSTAARLVERTRTLEQQAAVLSEQAALLDLAEDAIIVRDMDDQIVFWSSGAEAMYGWGSADALGQRKRELLKTELAEPDHLIEATLFSEGRWTGEATHHRRDGTPITVATRWSIQRSEDGIPLRMLTIDSDITERTAADAERQRLASDLSSHVDALRVSEERMNYALVAARVGVWDIDLASGRLTWSNTVAPMFGLTSAETPTTARDFLDLIHADDRSMVEEAIAEAARGGTSFDREFRVVWQDGSVHWLAGRGQAVHNPDVGSGVVTGVGMDISDQKSLELQFRQAQKMEAIGLLAGGVAHDFNNLLSVILGYSGFVTGTFGVHDERRSDMDEIVNAANRAVALTRQLLAFSRQQVLHPLNLDLNALVTGMLPMLRRLIGEHMELVSILEPGIGVVRADPGQVEQVLMNLVVNARDAMPTGGRLGVTTERLSIDRFSHGHHDGPPGEYVMLAVSDTGFGMSEETKSRLFQPFFTTKAPGEGSGLGLATAYGIINQSGGYVTVSTELGVGSTFRVYLPSVEGGVETIPALEDELVPAKGTGTILVIEDEEAVRLLTCRMLKNAGYRVLVAGDPTEAKALFREHEQSIDLVVTDVIMPGSSGPELCQQLLLKRPDLRVLYISGYTEDAILHHGRLDPKDDFLQKPFTANALCGRVRAALG